MSGREKTAKGVLAFAALVALGPVACSGDSTTSRGANGGKGGSNAEAGAPGGGTAGSGGASGGTGGGKGGASGSGGSGRSGASGSGTTAGAPSSGGESGEAGAGDAAGSPASGGAGGDTSSGGMGGGGAMRGYHPPAEQIDACTRMCEREAEASCPNEGTVRQCVDGCRVGLQFEACSTLWDEMFECVDSTETITCNAEGEASAAECATEYAEVVSCVFEDNLDAGYVPRCEAYCGALQPAACENTEPVDECENTCVILGSAFPVCSNVYADFLACGTDADITCDAEGKPSAEDCASEYVLFLSCLVSEYDWEL